MATSPDDADALFGGLPSDPLQPGASPFAEAPPPGGAELRKETRVKVSWPARVQLPNGSVLEVRVRDLSDNGVGLVSAVAIPAGAELLCAIGMPDIADPSRVTPITGTLRTSYMLVKGRDVYCGGTWVSLGAEARESVGRWMRRLRR